MIHLENHQFMLKLLSEYLQRREYLYSLKVSPHKLFIIYQKKIVPLQGGNLSITTLTKQYKLPSPILEQIDIIMSSHIIH